MTIENCGNCGGTHYGSFRCPHLGTEINMTDELCTKKEAMTDETKEELADGGSLPSEIKEERTVTGEAMYWAAGVAHAVNRAYCQSLGDDSQPPWADAPEGLQKSCFGAVRKIVANPAITPEQLHDRWCQHMLVDGWAHGDAKDPEAKTHPFLVQYAGLPHEQKVKDSLFGAAVRSALGLLDEE